MKSDLIDIACKKLPADLPFSNKQVDQIIQKVKLVPVPKSVVNETVYKEETIEGQVVRTVVAEKNTNERAIVRIRVPRKRIEEDVVDEATGAHHKVERFVDIEQDDRVLVHPAQIVNRDYTIYAFNQSAPRAQRREFFAALKKTFAEHFEGRDAHRDQELFNRRTEQVYERLEKQFIDKHSVR